MAITQLKASALQISGSCLENLQSELEQNGTEVKGKAPLGKYISHGSTKIVC